MDASQPQKNPVRVRTGRLGALATHSRGRTNVGPARAAFLARFETEVDPAGELDAAERTRRAAYALRAHMSRLASARWAGRRARARS